MEEGLLRERGSINAPGSDAGWTQTREFTVHTDLEEKKDPKAPRRLQCLDAVRGLNVMLMIFVDNCCDFPSTKWIDHSPWNVVHLADFVMPLFLFMVCRGCLPQLGAAQRHLTRAVWCHNRSACRWPFQ